MPKPVELVVRGMFGQLNHQLKLRTDDLITIITGPNGSGKTHLLNTLRSMTALDFAAVARLPLQEATITYDSGNSFTVRLEDGVAHVTARVSFRNRKGITFPVSISTDDDVPSHIERLDSDTWWNRRTSTVMTDEYMARRYNLTRVPYSEIEWLDNFVPPAEPILIDTERLDLSQQVDRGPANRPVRDRPEPATRIQRYVEKISSLILEAKRASLANSQRADRQFAARALDKAREGVKEVVLRDRYERIANLHQALHANSLTEESIGIEIPGKTNPTERRILNVFLDDWEEKLAPLLPVNDKIQLLREIVGAKMSMKQMHFDDDGRLNFTSLSGEPISVDLLSSGEQHLLALYTLLLFDAEPGSLVLIDEPEISLHAAWKHAFLSDISRVASLNALQVVVATHSTSIINGKWEIVEELGLGF